MANLYKRKWCGPATKAADSVTIAQFNILSDTLCQDDFPLVDRKYIKHDYRFPLIIAEIKSADADLMALEELEHFDTQYLPELKKYGYNGEFLKKPTNADGLAIMWRTDRFEKERLTQYSFKELISEAHNQVFMIGLFRDTQCDKRIVFAGTHLKAKAGAKNSVIRQAQVKCVREELSKFIEAHECQDAAIVFCGDCNAERDSPEMRGLRSELTIGEVVVSLGSAYDDEPENTAAKDSVPLPLPWTTYKARPPMDPSEGEGLIIRKRTIDYIIYSTRDFKTVRWMDLPNGNDIQEPYLPCARYPSDHIMLATTLERK
eukprot:Clim_evm35s147 gene=Clim_evmTU35s147